MGLRKHITIYSISKNTIFMNVLVKSFYKVVKRELIHDANFATPEQAQIEIFKYIESYYNTKRMHSSLQFKSPVHWNRRFHKINLRVPL